MYIVDSDSYWEHQVYEVVHLTCISPCWTRNVLLVRRGATGRGKGILYWQFSSAATSWFHNEYKNM